MLYSCIYTKYSVCYISYTYIHISHFHTYSLIAYYIYNFYNTSLWCQIISWYKGAVSFWKPFDPKELERWVTRACSYEALPWYVHVWWIEVKWARRAWESDTLEQRPSSSTDAIDTNEGQYIENFISCTRITDNCFLVYRFTAWYIYTSSLSVSGHTLKCYRPIWVR